MTSQEHTNQIIESLLQSKFIEPQCFLRNRLTLKEVAEIIGTNRTYLSNYLNDHKHTTFYHFLSGLRLDYAIQKMAEQKYSLKEIALNSGFSSYSSFHRAFIARYGYSPSKSL